MTNQKTTPTPSTKTLREQLIDALFDGDAYLATQYSSLAQEQHGWQQDARGRAVFICAVCSSHTRKVVGVEHVVAERACCRSMLDAWRRRHSRRAARA